MRKILLGATLLCSGLGFVNSAIAFPFAKKEQDKKDTKALKPLRSNMTPKISSPGDEDKSEIEAEKSKSKTASKDDKNQDGEKIEPPASKEERLAAKNLDIVAKARFWMTEFVKNQKDEEASIEASSALEQIGSYERAIEIAAAGIQINEKNVTLWRTLGMSLLKSGQAAASVGAFTKAGMLSPNDANLKNYLAIAYDNLGNFDMAYKTYNEARKLAPNDANIPSNQGFSLLMAGDFKAAEAILSEAIKMPNSPIQARQNLALAIGLQGRLKESEKIASEDLPPALAQKNIAFLREMLDGSQDRWKVGAVDKQSALKGSN